MQEVLFFFKKNKNTKELEGFLLKIKLECAWLRAERREPFFVCVFLLSISPSAVAVSLFALKENSRIPI
jgi:hypothetical protein